MTKHLISLLLALTVLLAGCQSAPAATTAPPAPSETIAPTTALAPSTEPSEPTGKTALLYVGTQDTQFVSYPLVYHGALTAEQLISGLAALTGWDLSLADQVYSGKGGMTVTFASTATLFTLDSSGAQEGFQISDPPLLARTILDSIQWTLQNAFVQFPGDPTILDIWYAVEDSLPLELPEIEKFWPLDVPYQWELPDPRSTIPFEDGQLFAIAWLGYQDSSGLTPYLETYLADMPYTSILSDGDVYLFIPRYDDMTIALYQNDMETGDRTLIERFDPAIPLMLSCNVSDIFPDATLVFTYGDTTVEYSPFISLKDGSLDVGEYGLNITIAE